MRSLPLFYSLCFVTYQHFTDTKKLPMFHSEYTPFYVHFCECSELKFFPNVWWSTFIYKLQHSVLFGIRLNIFRIHLKCCLRDLGHSATENEIYLDQCVTWAHSFSQREQSAPDRWRVLYGVVSVCPSLAEFLEWLMVLEVEFHDKQANHRPIAGDKFKRKAGY